MARVTRKLLAEAELGLQRILPGSAPTVRAAAIKAMRVLNEAAHEMRRKEIFDAGAAAKKPTPKFEGSDLGSMEAMVFYDGYASTHANFQNPYRTTR